jgi:hypothetical protein
LAGQYDAPLDPLLERFCGQDEAAEVGSPINVTDAQAAQSAGACLVSGI